MVDPGILAASLLQKHFVKFGSFRILCSYSSVLNSTQNQTTGVVSPVIDSVQDDVYFILDDFTYTQTAAAINREDDITILDIDKNAIVPAFDLNVVPKVGDFFTTDTGQVWKVKAIGQDPKPAHYELHVRPTI